MSDVANQTSNRTDVTVAIIGVIGVLITALVSNWDKLFPRDDQIKVVYNGYRPTGDFETEYRYFIEVSGLRKQTEALQQELFDHAGDNIKLETEDDRRKFKEYMSEILKVTPKIDDTIKSYIPIYQKHFTTEEIQELNKFYSTPQMRLFVNKQPLVNKELSPIMLKEMSELVHKISEIENKFFPHPLDAFAHALIQALSVHKNKTENVNSEKKEVKQLSSDNTKGRTYKKIK